MNSTNYKLTKEDGGEIYGIQIEKGTKVIYTTFNKDTKTVNTHTVEYFGCDVSTAIATAKKEYMSMYNQKVIDIVKEKITRETKIPMNVLFTTYEMFQRGTNLK